MPACAQGRAAIATPARGAIATWGTARGAIAANRGGAAAETRFGPAFTRMAVPFIDSVRRFDTTVVCAKTRGTFRCGR